MFFFVDRRPTAKIRWPRKKTGIQYPTFSSSAASIYINVGLLFILEGKFLASICLRVTFLLKIKFPGVKQYSYICPYFIIYSGFQFLHLRLISVIVHYMFAYPLYLFEHPQNPSGAYLFKYFVVLYFYAYLLCISFISIFDPVTVQHDFSQKPRK